MNNGRLSARGVIHPGAKRHRAAHRAYATFIRTVPLSLASVPLLLLFALPLLALVVYTSPMKILSALGDQDAQTAIKLSIATTLLATTITVIAGAPLAYLLARRRFPGRTALDTLIDLPMTLPPTVAGIALLLALGRRGLLGSTLERAHVELAFTWAAVVIAQVFVAAPYFVKTAIAGFDALDRELEQAAALDGANATQIFRTITLPLTAPTLGAGIVMTWARALGEFGATIIFAGNFPGRTQTMPLAIYIGFELNLRLAIALAVALLALSFSVLFLVKGVLRRRIVTFW